MDYETIPLSRLETNLRTTLDDCVRSGRTVVVELPDHRRVALRPLADGGAAKDGADDQFMDHLIASDSAFRTMVEKSGKSGSAPFSLELEPE